MAALARNRACYPKAVAEHVAAALATRDGLFREDAPQFVPPARDFALLVVERALTDAMQQEEYARTLRTAMMAEMLHGRKQLGEQAAKEAERGTAADARHDARHDAKLDAIIAAITHEKTPPGVPPGTVLTLARRVATQIEDVDGAVATIHAAIDELIVLRDRAARGSNLGALVDEALRRIAERNARNEFDEGAKAGDDAYAELRRPASRAPRAGRGDDRPKPC